MNTSEYDSFLEGGKKAIGKAWDTTKMSVTVYYWISLKWLHMYNCTDKLNNAQKCLSYTKINAP